MNYLGIDFGKRKIGLALGSDKTKFAEPLTVVKGGELGESLRKIMQVISAHEVEKVVVGVSEGISEGQAKEFGKRLQSQNIEVIYQDETLSTKEAQQKSIEAGIGRNKRRGMEDAYAATLILQNYLDII